MRIGGKNGQAVGGADEDASADDQVAVAVAVGSRSQIGGFGRHHQVVQLFGMNQVGIRMMSTEVLGWFAVDHGSGRRAQGLLCLLYTSLGLGREQGMERIEPYRRTTPAGHLIDQPLQRGEIADAEVTMPSQRIKMRCHTDTPLPQVQPFGQMAGRGRHEEGGATVVALE